MEYWPFGLVRSEASWVCRDVSLAWSAATLASRATICFVERLAQATVLVAKSTAWTT
jgi:hypothetical protein